MLIFAKQVFVTLRWHFKIESSKFTPASNLVLHSSLCSAAFFQRFVNFGKPTLRPWQSVTPLPSRLAPTFQAAAVSSPVVAQQTVPSLRLPAELSSSSSRVKQQQQQARLVQLPRAKGQVEVNLLEGDRFNLVSNAVELPVRLHPEEELASRG